MINDPRDDARIVGRAARVLYGSHRDKVGTVRRVQRSNDPVPEIRICVLLPGGQTTAGPPERFEIDGVCTPTRPTQEERIESFLVDQAMAEMRRRLGLG